MKTPDFTPRQVIVERDYVNGLLGLNLSSEEIASYLERMRYGADACKDSISVRVPAYRTDVLHPMDLVEDVAIAYGYHNFIPRDLSIHSRAVEDPLEKKTLKVREALVGLGFTEAMTLILTNKNALFSCMNLPEEKVVEAENPASTEHCVCRSWLLPSLMGLLAKNKTREFPQKIFEVGDVVLPSGQDIKHVSGVVSHAKTNFSEIKSIVDGLLSTLGVECKVKQSVHSSFIPGRCAETKTGFFGEVNPQVLSNFGLEMPVTAFELSLEEFSSD
ncbi:MAG: hypothetical protein ABH834_02345 [Candidatus Altiarchaeota archaeon]